MSGATSFVPPPYPYDRLAEIAEIASKHVGGAVDLSIGTPCDPPPTSVVNALCSSHAERGYPASTGTFELRDAAARWMSRRFAVEVEPAHVAACVGSKEFVASLAWYMRLRLPHRDTVIHPATAYPTYEMSAQLAGCRSVGVPERDGGGLDLGSIDEADAQRALLLWVNSPANPTGSLTDLAEAAQWGRTRGVPVFSDECYAEFTWAGSPSTILSSGSAGVVAVHSLSKRSNLAGCRVGFFAGDPDLVTYLSEVRRHAGLMVPGPDQHAAAVALDDDDHVELQRGIYWRRLERLARVLEGAGLEAPLPDGAFYLWVPVPEWAGGSEAAGDGDVAPGRDRDVAPGRVPDAGQASGAFVFARALAEAGGMLVSPGDLYGAHSSGHVRIAVVQPDDRIELVAERLAANGHLLSP
jgi:aspartate/methionine/tyrosine aminotransferase